MWHGQPSLLYESFQYLILQRSVQSHILSSPRTTGDAQDEECMDYVLVQLLFDQFSFFTFGLGQFSALTVLWGIIHSDFLALYISAPSIHLAVSKGVIVYTRKEGTAVLFLSSSGLCSYLRLTRGCPSTDDFSLNGLICTLGLCTVL